MFSIADMAVAGAVALLLFGPDQLPKVARRAGQLVRDVQNTSQSFIREIERAADVPHSTDSAVVDSAQEQTFAAAPLYHETPIPAPHELGAASATPISPGVAPAPHSTAPEHATDAAAHDSHIVPPFEVPHDPRLHPREPTP